MPSFQAHMGNYDSNDPADQTRKGWLTSILELGAWLGTLLSGFMAETASRKYGILIATAVFIVGVVVQATAITAGHNAILGGRFIT
jgi:MFS family permease